MLIEFGENVLKEFYKLFKLKSLTTLCKIQRNSRVSQIYQTGAIYIYSIYIEQKTMYMQQISSGTVLANEHCFLFHF